MQEINVIVDEYGDDGFVWIVIVDGKVREHGYHDVLRQARKDAQASAMFWQLHDYNFED